MVDSSMPHYHVCILHIFIPFFILFIFVKIIIDLFVFFIDLLMYSWFMFLFVRIMFIKWKKWIIFYLFVFLQGETIEAGQENKIIKRKEELLLIEKALKSSSGNLRSALKDVESFLMTENDKKLGPLKLKLKVWNRRFFLLVKILLNNFLFYFSVLSLSLKCHSLSLSLSSSTIYLSLYLSIYLLIYLWPSLSHSLSICNSLTLLSLCHSHSLSLTVFLSFSIYNYSSPKDVPGSIVKGCCRSIGVEGLPNIPLINKMNIGEVAKYVDKVRN